MHSTDIETRLRFPEIFRRPSPRRGIGQDSARRAPAPWRDLPGARR